MEIEEEKPKENGESSVSGVAMEVEDSGATRPAEPEIFTHDPSVFSDRSIKLLWENGIGTFPGTGLKVIFFFTLLPI